MLCAVGEAHDAGGRVEILHTHAVGADEQAVVENDARQFGADQSRGLAVNCPALVQVRGGRRVGQACVEIAVDPAAVVGARTLVGRRGDARRSKVVGQVTTWIGQRGTAGKLKDVETPMFAQAIPAPGGKQHVRRHVLYVQIHADGLHHLHDERLRLLAQRIVGGGLIPEAQLDALLEANAVRPWQPPGLFQ